MSDAPIPNAIFCQQRRCALRDRAAQIGSDDIFIWDYLAEELHDRLQIVLRDFDKALVIGPLADRVRTILGSRSPEITYAHIGAIEVEKFGGVQISEDILPFDSGSFDLIIAAGSLDSVNDLPGLLIQLRRLLIPDGLFLAALFGAGTLKTLRAIMLQAEADAPKAHFHPQIDLQSAAALLLRAQFALPVADEDSLHIRYKDWRRLVADIRAMGVGNALVGSRHYLGRRIMHELDKNWQMRKSDDGKVTEYFNFIHLSGWSPSPNQPKPARRGSASVSLADILKSS